MNTNPVDQLLTLYNSLPNDTSTQEATLKDKEVTRVFIKSVGDTQTFEVKEIGLFAAIRQFFSRLVSPKTYNLEENLKKVQEQLKKIKPEEIDAEQVEQLNALTQKLDTIRKLAIKSLEKPTLFGSQARMAKVGKLKSIEFRRIKAKETPPLSSKTTSQEVEGEGTPTANQAVDLGQKVDLVVGRVEILSSVLPEETPSKHTLLAAEVDKACKELSQNSYELLKVLEMATEEQQQLELPLMRKARDDALHVCLALTNKVEEDATWPSDKAKQEVTTQLQSTMNQLLAEIKLIDSYLLPKAEPTPPTLASHNITKKLINAAASITTRDIEQAAMVVFSAKSANLPSIALAIVAPYVVNLFVEKASQKVLPNDLSPNAQHLASFVKTMSSALLLVYGIDYLRGPSAYTVTTKPLDMPANSTLAEPVCDISQAPNATMTPVTPITYVEPIKPIISQPTTPANATVSFMPDVSSPAAQPLPQTSQGWWGTIAGVVNGVAEGFFDPIKNPALEALQIQGDK